MKHIILGTAGHVDHGKTALVKALTGFDCDTHPEEKKRGITINLGFTHLTLGDDKVGIIDVPGHKDFIHNMVAGASGIDFGLLVVAANEGVMPQTREHIEIMDALSIKSGIVVLTKCDLADDEMISIAKNDIKKLTDETFLKNAPIIQVSSTSGFGIDELKSTISEIIKSIPERPQGGDFRMFIDRAFYVQGFGAVFNGSVLSGRLESNQEIFVIPGDRKSHRIRRIERDRTQVDEVVAGDRASINIPGFKLDGFRRGQLISNRALETTQMVDAKIKLFRSSKALSLWSNVTFHLGTFESMAKVHLIDRNRLKGDERAIAQIHLPTPCAIAKGDKFIMRNSSGDMTIGAGEIIDSNPLHHRRRTKALIERINRVARGEAVESVVSPPAVERLLRKIDEASTDELNFVEKLLADCGTKTPLESELIEISKGKGIDKGRLKFVLNSLVKKGRVYSIEGNYIHASIVDEFRKKLVEALKSTPSGMTVAEFRDLIGANRKFCLLLLSRYDSEGTTMRVGDRRILNKAKEDKN
ncbi:MAG: selenocysteine-specific translation elongation factor [Pseudomonadota bacterium]